MTPTFGMSRPHQDMSSHGFRRPGPPPIAPSTPGDSTVNLSFNVPFSASLAGPDPDEIIHSTPSSFERWTFPEGTPEGTPIHKLPVHANNVDALRKLCRQISETSGGRIEATVTSSEPKVVPSLQRRPQGLVTNVCISGDGDIVQNMRAKIFKETPIALVSFPQLLSMDWMLSCIILARE